MDKEGDEAKRGKREEVNDESEKRCGVSKAKSSMAFAKHAPGIPFQPLSFLFVLTLRLWLAVRDMIRAEGYHVRCWTRNRARARDETETPS